MPKYWKVKNVFGYRFVVIFFGVDAPLRAQESKWDVV